MTAGARAEGPRTFAYALPMAPTHPRLPWSDLEAALRQLPGVTEYGRTRDGLPLLRASSPGEPWVLVLACLHGEETAGANTWGVVGADLFRYANTKGVGLRVYPCCNPHGYENNRRYGSDGRTATNAAFVYRLRDGSTRTAIKEGDDYAGFADRPLAYETRLLLKDLGKPATLPAAIVDLHQDGEVAASGFYAYVFGDRAKYHSACDASSEFLPPVVGSEITAGQSIPAGKTDEHGLVSLSDGAVTDVYFHLGVPWIATVETTIDSDPGKAIAVAATWVRAAIDSAV